jgi:hypothetical protein
LSADGLCRTPQTGAQHENVRHTERLLEKLGEAVGRNAIPSNPRRMSNPSDKNVAQSGQDERRDAERSLPAVGLPLSALPTGLAQRHCRHGKRQIINTPD